MKTTTLKAGDIEGFPTTARDWQLYSMRGVNIIARNLAQRLLADLKDFKKEHGNPADRSEDFLTQGIQQRIENTRHLMGRYSKYGASDTEGYDAMAYGVQVWLEHEGVHKWIAQRVARYIRW